MSSTIIAQCTPTGSGAIALIRISGPEALTISDQFIKIKNQKIVNLQTHTVHLAKAYTQSHDDLKTLKLIDQVMVIVMQAPKTFTGENTVEITCHNNQLIIETIIQEAIKHGALQAMPGQFAEQAVLNKKMDIIQAESINELINAKTMQALSKSLEQIEGTLSNLVNILQNELLQALALCESSFEFLDDEEISFDAQILNILQDAKNKIDKLNTNGTMQRQIRQGYRVVLLGPVNAGKSSLFNALIDEEKAIVTHIAGTTRDVIEATTDIDNQTITFVDTAGLRTTDDLVESIGIKRSQAEAKKADLILLVHNLFDDYYDNNFYENLVTDNIKTINIASKIDDLSLLAEIPRGYIALSTSKNFGISELKKIIKNEIDNLAISNTGAYLLTKRQIYSINTAANFLDKAIDVLNKNKSYELAVINLTQAIQDLGQLSGKTVSHEVMDVIFRQFCVGK
jgi:tRNA modification GTPase